jgi:small subunit ribosomal protein S3
MGQKTHPKGFRLGISKTWDSRWYAEKKDFATFLHEDLKIRKFLKSRLYHTGVASIEIERLADKEVRIGIFTARPGLVIGKKGSDVDALRGELEKLTGRAVRINIKEVRKPEAEAQLIAEAVALQLEKRIAFRRAMKKSVQSALKMGVKGIKIMCAGRLAGAEIARTEWYREGRVPLHTLRADVEYGFAEAHTTFGVIGIKVWVYTGDVFGKENLAERKQER